MKTVMVLKKLTKNNKGFTLIEVIAVLVLSGVLAGIVGTGLVQISKSFIFTKQNMGTTQKAQLAMLRILKEFTNISSITAGASNTSITFVSQHATAITYTLSWAGAGNPLLLTTGGNDYTLTDNVNNFNLLYYNTYASASEDTWTNGSSSIIQVTLDLTGAEGIVSGFTTRVEPRNIPAA